jgi:hypothetical protein
MGQQKSNSKTLQQGQQKPFKMGQINTHRDNKPFNKDNKTPQTDNSHQGEMPPVPPHSATAKEGPRHLCNSQGTTLALRLLYRPTAKGEVNQGLDSQERSDTSTPTNKIRGSSQPTRCPSNYLRSETENPLEGPHHHQRKTT